MRKLTRYIVSHVVLSTLMVCTVVLALEFFMELLGQASFIGKHQYGLIDALIYVATQMPADLYQMFPMIGFLGSLIGLGRLASQSELLVMRASGLSKAAIVRAVVLAAVLMMSVVILLGEVIGPVAQSYGQNLRHRALQSKLFNASGSAWLKQGQRIIYVDKVVSPVLLSGVTVFDFSDDANLTTTLYAPTVRLVNRVWQGENVRATTLSNGHTRASHVRSMPLDITFIPSLQQKTEAFSVRESVVQLLKNIFYLKAIGVSSQEFQYAFWQRIFSPITSITMICLGVPFVFGSLRSSSMGSRVLLGIIVGFGFYMLNQFFGPVTLVLQFPPLAAALAPTLLFMVIYYILVRRVH